MQATAPGNRSEPHAGHFVGAAAGLGGAPAGSEACGRGADPDPPPAATPAPTGCGAGVAPIMKTVWHLGHLTCLPVASSGTCIRIGNMVQLITWCMIDPGLWESSQWLTVL